MSTTKEKVAIYARTSPGEGAWDRLSDQLDALVKHCRGKGYEVDQRYFYTDSASAAGRGIDGRLGFTSLVEDAELGKFKTIAAWDIDRLARSPESYGYLMDAMRKHKFKIITLAGRVYLPEDNVLLASVEMGLASQYIRPRGQECNCHELR